MDEPREVAQHLSIALDNAPDARFIQVPRGLLRILCDEVLGESDDGSDGNEEASTDEDQGRQ